jgi:two-component system nitrogen regulation response regulator NtrX
LITGENGTGKELVARTIHQFSDRADQPLIDVNCAAIPEELIESELFGHEKGAITGATVKKRGKFELASGGTIFFDEIGDMSLKTQAKILRILQEKQFQRVGGSRVLDINVRVIAASNKDLEKEIEKGNFREDLYYRLNVIPIEVPALRNRIEDIPLLVVTFLEESARQNRNKRKEMTREALSLLSNYSWPGNVRELKNLVERLSIMVETDVINVSDIPPPYSPDSGKAVEQIESELFFIDDLKDAKKAFENEFIKRKLMQHGNNANETAKIVGVSRSFLNKKLENIKTK